MRFTDGYWTMRPGVTAHFGRRAHDVRRTEATPDGPGLEVLVPTADIADRADTLNCPTLTVTLSAPLPGVIRVRIAHHVGGRWHEGFDLPGLDDVNGTRGAQGEVEVAGSGATLTSGSLVARIAHGSPWSLTFEVDGVPVTSSRTRSLGYLTLDPDADVHRGVVTNSGRANTDNGAPSATTFIHEQLDLDVGELIYGLGEQFGPLVKNGQSIEIWNADGGTASDQSYKSVPFYLSSRGYGVFVNDPGHVSFEVGSEAVERVQFSVSGEVLEYFVFAGPTPKDIIGRYTALTGRPPVLPAWSYGLWLSTSFTTSYDEETVIAFVDEMARRDLPLSVFHFDCFWMKEFQWCDFEWDPEVFPDPDGMLDRLHARDLRICVWINPYIAQRSRLFAEAAELGHLVRRSDGSVWQWDLWQAGMGLIDVTSPEAVAWFQDKLRALLDQGVDCFKTDFGERIPTDVVWADGSDPERMHNRYAQLYNTAVHDVLVEARGEGDAVLFARAATAGGQTLPVHWGGDCDSTFRAMAGTLRGGLSLALSGFAHWSHDIGGFEGTPDAAVFKRWTAFGLLCSHSRFHGSTSYRVPWAFDEEAVEVTRIFTRLKMRLMPYLHGLGQEAASTGVPILRPMLMEFPDDPAVVHLDRQYMLGPDLLVAPVFTTTGEVSFYLPAGRWTHLLTGEVVDAGPGGWRTETHGFTSLPLYVRPGAVLPWGARDDRPDYDYADGLTHRVFSGNSAAP